MFYEVLRTQNRFRRVFRRKYIFHVSFHVLSRRFRILDLYKYLRLFCLIIVGWSLMKLNTDMRFLPALSNEYNYWRTIEQRNYQAAKAPTIEIITVVPRVECKDFEYLKKSITSWYKVEKKPTVTILGNSFHKCDFSANFELKFENSIDHSFNNIPLFNSVLSRAEKSRADVVVLLKYDVILQDGFYNALKTINDKFQSFVAIGVGQDMGGFKLNEMQFNTSYGGNNIDNIDRTEFWAWKPSARTIFPNRIPPFFYFNNDIHEVWLTENILSRFSGPIVYVKSSARGRKTKLDLFRQKSINEFFYQNDRNGSDKKIKADNFEKVINTYQYYKSKQNESAIENRKDRVSPWVFEQSLEDGKYKFTGNVVSRRSPLKYKLDKVRRETPALGYPILQAHFTRESLRKATFGLPLTQLDAIASVVQNRTVIVTAVNYGYRYVMMNWVCNLRRLQIKNFLVAALDESLYRFAISRGVATYYENSFDKGMSEEGISSEGEYGSAQFQKLTKLKTRVVVGILRLGFDVLWSDCDIVYFRNPIPTLMHTSGDLVIQSNAPDEEMSNWRRRMNSGFYLARSSQHLIYAFDLIVRKAQATNLTEQPCFYDILCGVNGEKRVGDNMCKCGRIVSTFLDRTIFANGITKGMWGTTPGSIEKMYPNTIILHNNWVKGLRNKKKRLLEHGYVIYDYLQDICVHERFGKPALH